MMQCATNATHQATHDTRTNDSSGGFQMRLILAPIVFTTAAAWSYYCWAGHLPTQELYGALKSILAALTF